VERKILRCEGLSTLQRIQPPGLAGEKGELMLGAVEIAVITRLAAEHPDRWRDVHRGVLSCLLAHHNRKTNLTKPGRQLMADYCGVSLDTVDRVLSDFREWNLLKWTRGGRLKGGLKIPNQYEFLFPIPDVAQGPQNRDLQGPQNSDYKGRNTRAAKTPFTRAAPCCGPKPFEALNLEALNLEALGKLWKIALEIADQDLEQTVKTEAQIREADDSFWEVVMYGFRTAFDESVIVRVQAPRIFVDAPDRNELQCGLNRFDNFVLDGLEQQGLVNVELQPYTVSNPDDTPERFQPMRGEYYKPNPLLKVGA
jgi:hypothetical protein